MEELNENTTHEGGSDFLLLPEMAMATSPGGQDPPPLQGYKVFLNSYRECGAMQVQPPEKILELLLYQQVQRSQAIRDQIAYRDQLDMGHPDRSYKFLVSAIRKHIEQKSTIEARDAFHKNMSWNNALVASCGAGGDSRRRNIRKEGSLQALDVEGILPERVGLSVC